MSGPRPPRIVAELGRPETPQETADRKARDRALRRSRQNTRNLVASLVVTTGLAIVLVVLFVPFGDTVQQPTIDPTAVAEQFGDTAGQPLLAPAVPASWSANAAQLRGSGDGTSWYVGWVADGAYFGLTEGIPGTATTLRSALEGATPTGTTTVGGLPWRVYDRRDLGSGAGNVAYGLATRIGKAVVAVYGTGTAQQVRTLAAAVARDAAARGLGTEGTLP